MELHLKCSDDPGYLHEPKLAFAVAVGTMVKVMHGDFSIECYPSVVV